jgi:uncharacterized membrane protein
LRVDSARSKVQTFLDSTVPLDHCVTLEFIAHCTLDVISPNALRSLDIRDPTIAAPDLASQNWTSQVLANQFQRVSCGGNLKMQHFVAVAASLVMPTITGKEAAQLILRWFHIIAGIAWVGLLYFFNLINVPFMKQVDAAAKPKIFQYLTLPALNWFRWSALATVFIGLWYWGQFLVAPDAQRQGVGQGSTFGLFLLLWIGVWGILFFLIKKVTPSGYVLGAITAILVYAAGWVFVNYTPVGGDDNHVVSIGVGGGMGIVMLFNVWGIIWPNNKKIIRGTLAGTPPANAAIMARQAFLASRTNFFLSVPLIFYMAAASHFSSTVIFGK